jgi:hypothetical protein
MDCHFYKGVKAFLAARCYITRVSKALRTTVVTNEVNTPYVAHIIFHKICYSLDTDNQTIKWINGHSKFAYL